MNSNDVGTTLAAITFTDWFWVLFLFLGAYVVWRERAYQHRQSIPWNTRNHWRNWN